MDLLELIACVGMIFIIIAQSVYIYFLREKLDKK